MKDCMSNQGVTLPWAKTIIEEAKNDNKGSLEQAMYYPSLI